MSRLLPLLGVALLAGLIGCGGGGGGIGSTGSTTPTTTTGTNGDPTTDLRPLAGDYSATLTGSDGTTTYAGSGTATVTSNGTISVSYSATPAGGTTATAHALAVTVTEAGVATGSLTTGATTLPAAGTLADNADGSYLLTVATVNGAVTETDRFTLTSITPPAGTYKGQNTGTDDQGGTYSGAASVIVGGDGGFSAGITSTRQDSGTSSTLGQTIPSGSGKFAANGTFTATLNQGAGSVFNSTTITGKWTLSNKILTLKFTFENQNYLDGASGNHPNTTETLTLTTQ